MRYKVAAEFIPEPAYEGVEWGWEAKVHEAELGDKEAYLNQTYEIESKFAYASREEAVADLESTLPAYLKALQEDRLETYYLEAE